MPALVESRVLLLCGLFCIISFTDECQPDSCPVNAICAQTPNGYECSCIDGFESRSRKQGIRGNMECVDIDECAQRPSPCGPHSTCNNTMGSYSCRCLAGFLPPPATVWKPGIHGTSHCTDVNECLNTKVCPAHAICTNMSGKYFCTCKNGFATSSGEQRFVNRGVECKDVDECLDTTACPVHATCSNTLGTYFCTCKKGFASSSGELKFVGEGVSCKENLSNSSDLKNENTVSQDCDIKPNTTYYRENSSQIYSHLRRLSRGCGYGNAALSLQEITNFSEALSNNMFQVIPGRKEKTIPLVTLFLESVQSGVFSAALRLSANETLREETEFMGIETRKVKGPCTAENEIFHLMAKNESLKIHCSTVNREDLKGAVVFISYATLGSIMNESITQGELRGFHLNSKVVSGTIGLGKNMSLSAPVNFTFQHVQALTPKERSLCVYWNNITWSKQGCEVISADENQTRCSCNHLSTFAVLLASTDLKEDPVLTLITYMGLSLSLLCLFLAALTFLLCRAIQNTSTSLHLQLSVCLFLADLLFLTGIKRTEPELLCSIIAGVLHYLFLAAFTWMLLEGLHLFLTVRNLKVANYTSASRLKKRFMYPFGYGIPAGIVAITAGVGYRGYGTSTHCWLKIKGGYIWGFLGPIVAIITMNLSFYLTTLWILRDKLCSLNKDVSKIQNTRTLTFKALAQLFILGCSWCLGFLLIEPMGDLFRSVIAYAFTITNSLQGVYIFVVHCLLNHQVKDEYKKWFKGLQKRTETDSYMLTGSTTHTRMEELEKTTDYTRKRDSSYS
ncbi:adhesion G protein-coupled receptor E3 [Tachyglossus aculeatus]|uniref:adhesion G protein-coupled receptor E3 n=1 Tax=Tachyglossus aculeatus TaxID=9261 RepID=UPI0018F433EB|nr:adhesion G protein-coupled receptor E3 [Tachyglossus aculeatus]